MDGKRIYGLPEGVEQDLSGLGLREITQHRRVFEIHRRGLEQMPGHEVPYFWVKQVVTADQAQILQQLPREKTHNRAVIGGAYTVQLDRVMHLSIQDGLKDDLAGFLRREGFQRESGIA